jgi:hypothetical protein
MRSQTGDRGLSACVARETGFLQFPRVMFRYGLHIAFDSSGRPVELRSVAARSVQRRDTEESGPREKPRITVHLDADLTLSDGLWF